MIRDNEQNNEMLKAILDESGLPQTLQELIKKIYETQQKTIWAMEEFLRRDGWRQKHVDERLNKLLEKICPEEAKQEGKGLAYEDQAQTKMPSTNLI